MVCLDIPQSTFGPICRSTFSTGHPRPQAPGFGRCSFGGGVKNTGPCWTLVPPFQVGILERTTSNHRCPFWLFWQKNSWPWFTWWFSHLPRPSICPKRTPMPQTSGEDSRPPLSRFPISKSKPRFPFARETGKPLIHGAGSHRKFQKLDFQIPRDAWCSCKLELKPPLNQWVGTLNHHCLLKEFSSSKLGQPFFNGG